MVIYKSYNLPSIHEHCNTNGYDVFGNKIVLYNRDTCVDIGDIFEFYNSYPYAPHELFAEVYNVVRNPHETWCYTTITGLLCCDGVPINTFKNDTPYTPDYIYHSYPSGGLRDAILYVGWSGSYYSNRIGFGESVWCGRDIWLSFDILIESDYTGLFYGNAHPAGTSNHNLGSIAQLYRTGVPGELRGTSTPTSVPSSYSNYTCPDDIMGGHIRILLYNVSNIASYIRVTLSNICYKNVHGEIMPSGWCIPSNYSTLIHGP